MAVLTQEQLNAIAKGSGYGGTFSSTGLASKAQVSNETLGILDSNSLKSQDPITLPTKQPDTTNYSGMINGWTAQSAAYSPQPGTEDLFKQYMGALTPPPSTAATYQQDYNAAGIDTLQGNVNMQSAEAKKAMDEFNAINAQLAGLTAEAQAIPVQIQQDFEGRGATKAGVAPVEASELRKIALRALPLQAQAIAAQAKVQAAQGNVELAQNTLKAAQDKLNTVYQLHVQDAQNQYNYKNKLLESVYSFADKAEQRRIDQLKTENTQKFDLFKMQAQQELDIEKIKLAESLKPKPVGTGTTEETSPAGTLQLAQARGQIDTISSLLSDGAIRSAVGPNMFSRFIGKGLDSATGARGNYLANVQQLTSQLTLDNLISAKARGATFGALSEGELSLLAASASKLKTWAKTDKDGNFTAIKTSEKLFKQELDKINYFAKLDYVLRGGNPTEVATQMPDGTFWIKNSDGTYTQLK